MTRRVLSTRLAGLAIALCHFPGAAFAQEPPAQIPHAQDRPPNPPRNPAEAIAAMTVPDGFQVELVAAEPDLVNPVAMTFDEKGRIWVTESLEYPRKDPGPGRDRVKVLDDANRDGRIDRITTFCEGLNIPSGIAVGHGGVWVANSPDLLFYPDADRDAVPDGPPTVVATGFGRADTHELPNSLTWGPDGWLYGWNGVFNPSRVVSNNGKTYQFTCAIFRVHPVSHEFQVWCEGTSNPWGIAANDEGDFFASACVIDHLWHLVESAYYIRQGGPYPPFTWPMPSIVDHTHQKAAYCGIVYFDSDAYPPEYRGKLYMGNIHGGCINVDEIKKQGASYRGEPRPDFLSANDAWFMPVSQKVGPDGCLYVLDWYDRYHCYQDANRDPAGIDRLKGRLYRIRYQGSDSDRQSIPNMPRTDRDLAACTPQELIQLLAHPNVFVRDTCRRLLVERLPQLQAQGINTALSQAALSTQKPATQPDGTPEERRRSRLGALNALWVLVATDRLDPALHAELLRHPDPAFRAWAVRAAGGMTEIEPTVLDRVTALAADPAPEVRLQVAIAGTKLAHVDPVPLLLSTLNASDDDRLLAHVVWQNLHPLLDTQATRFCEAVEKLDLDNQPGVATLLPRALELLLASTEPNPLQISRLASQLASSRHHEEARQALDRIATRLRQNRQAAAQDPLRKALVDALSLLVAAQPDQPVGDDIKLVLACCGDRAGLDAARTLLQSPSAADGLRLRALDVLLYAESPERVRQLASDLLDASHSPSTPDFRGKVLAALGEQDDPALATVVLAAYPTFEPGLKPRVLELLTSRPSWSKQLLAAVETGAVPKEAINVNQLRRLQASADPEVVEAVRKRWGVIRDGRDPARELVLGQLRNYLRKTPGDPMAGKAAFQKVCAQCHKLYGEGAEVGPDITLNGRNDYDQLLSNVFDPNLVIGPGYQATTIATTDGRVLSGLLIEDSPDRLLLRIQGGQTTVIPRAEVEERTTANLSLMPEGVETQLSPQELADLFAYLALDKPPEDPTARRLPGAPEPVKP